MEKNKIWIWRAVDGVSRRAISWHVGDRSDSSLREFIHRIDNGSCTLVTNEWEGFFRCLPEDRHFFGKDLTFVIESTNSDIRHAWRVLNDDQKLPAAALIWLTDLYHYFIISRTISKILKNSFDHFDHPLVKCLKILSYFLFWIFSSLVAVPHLIFQSRILPRLSTKLMLPFLRLLTKEL